MAGVDGSWVQRSDLQIEADRFVARDLSLPCDLGRRFYLVACLEVVSISAKTPQFKMLQTFGYKAFDCIRSRIWWEEKVSSCSLMRAD